MEARPNFSKYGPSTLTRSRYHAGTVYPELLSKGADGAAAYGCGAVAPPPHQSYQQQPPHQQQQVCITKPSGLQRCSPATSTDLMPLHPTLAMLILALSFLVALDETKDLAQAWGQQGGAHGNAQPAAWGGQPQAYSQQQPQQNQVSCDLLQCSSKELAESWLCERVDVLPWRLPVREVRSARLLLVLSYCFVWGHEPGSIYPCVLAG